MHEFHSVLLHSRIEEAHRRERTRVRQSDTKRERRKRNNYITTIYCSPYAAVMTFSSLRPVEPMCSRA